MKLVAKVFIGIAIIAVGYGIFWAYNFLTFLNELGGPEQTQFQQEIWLTHNDLDDLENPRGGMIDDLFANHLKKGFHRNKVVELLGEPYSETVTRRLPKGMSTPDSIAPHKFVGQPRELQDSILAVYNAWNQANGQLDTLMLYPIGWHSGFGIDPDFLAVRLNKDSLTIDFWTEQH